MFKALAAGEMQANAALQHHMTPVRMAKVKETMANVDDNVGTWDPIHCW